MDRKRRMGLIIAGGLLVLLAGVASWPGEQPAPEAPARGPLDIGLLDAPAATGTPTPDGYRPGLCDVRQFSAVLTPAPGQVCSSWEVYWSTAQPNLTATPNWGPVRTRVAYLATQGLSSAPALQFNQDVSGPTPDLLTMPQGAPTVVYTAGSCNEVAPNYGDPRFQDAYDRAVQSFCAWADADPNVSAVPLLLGQSGETDNTYPDTTACGADKQQALERVVSATAYINWVKHAMVTWRTYCPHKVLTLATNLGTVYGWSGWASAREFMEYAAPSTATPGAPPAGNPAPTRTPLAIGYRFNGLQYGDQRNYNWGTPNAPWGRLQAGARQAEVGGASYETFYGPAAIAAMPTAERVGRLTDMTLSALGPGRATNLFYQFTASGGTCGWDCYITPFLANVITQTAGLDATNSAMVWVRFRDAERRRIGSYDYSNSDWPGPFTHLVTVRASREPTRYCWPSVYATAQADGTSGYATPVVCQAPITPVVAESRNVLNYAAGTSVYLDVADDWQYAGLLAGAYAAQLTYLDQGTDTLVVNWSTSMGTTSRTITKTDSGTWQTESWTLAGALRNGFSAGDLAGDLRIDTGGTGAEFLYFFSLTWAGGAAPTATPSATVTPSRTPYPVTPSVTPVPRGPELFTNGGFETFTGDPDDGVSDTFSGWDIYYDNPTLERAEATTNLHSGYAALKLTAAAGSYPIFHAAFSVTAGSTYILSFFAHGDGTLQGIYALYAGATLLEASGTGVIGAAYEQVSTSITMPAGETTLQLYVYAPASGSGSAYYDDFTLAEVATPTPSPTPAALAAGETGPLGSTWIGSNYPTAPLDDAGVEYVGWQNGAAWGADLLQWPDLAKPAGATFVEAATLTLYAVAQTPADEGYALRAYALQREWSPAGATWQQSGAAGAWEIPGARGATDRGTSYTSFTAGTAPDGSAQAVTVDVTNIVRGWLDAGLPNYGIGLYAEGWCAGVCLAWVGFAGDAHAVLEYRPVLAITYGYATTVTPSPTPSPTPTLPATPTAGATPTLTRTPTGTPTITPTPLPGLHINEVCPDPATDANLDGSVGPGDRALELFNPGASPLDLAGYRLVFNGLGRGRDTRYILPKYTQIAAGGYKVIYSYQLRNPSGDAFVMPGGPDTTTVELFDRAGLLLDSLTWNWPGLGYCWARWPNGGPAWSPRALPTLGRAN